MAGTRDAARQAARRYRWALPAALLCLTLLSGGCAARKPKMYRVGVICGAEQFSTTTDGFKARMAELGYREGTTIRYDVRNLNNDTSAIDGVLASFIADKVDLILAFPSEPARAGRIAVQGTSIPLLFAWCSTEIVGLVDSVARPGGNTTGVRLHALDLVPKRLEILLQLVPRAKRVWLPHDPSVPSVPAALELLRTVASLASITLVETPLRTVEDLRTEIDRRIGLEDVGFDAILVMPDAIVSSEVGWALVSELAASRGLPVAAQVSQQVEQGAILSYSPDNPGTGRLAAEQAHKILQGTPAGTIPVVSAEGSLWLNHGAMEKLGLTVPEGLLRRASRVIR